jgi:hypothetical protein
MTMRQTKWASLWHALTQLGFVRPICIRREANIALSDLIGSTLYGRGAELFVDDLYW